SWDIQPAGDNSQTTVSTLSQTGIPFVIPASGYMDAGGCLVIGQNPPTGATMYLESSTAGTNIAMTFNAATLAGTAAGDDNRIITINDGTCIYKTATITGGSGILTVGTLTGTATTGTYTSTALTSTSGTGSGAIATVTVTAGAVTGVAITTAGAGYSVGDGLSFTVTGGSGTAKVATIT